MSITGFNFKTKYKSSIPTTSLQNFNNVKINYDLFYHLLMFRTHSFNPLQDELLKYIEEYIIKNCNNVIIEYDTYGNLYVTKGIATHYNCVVAHVDINQDEIENVSIIKHNDFIFGFDDDNKVQCGLGFDDKVGVYFNLHCLLNFENIKAVFTKDEEVGCIGTSHLDLTFFENVNFLLQLDRNSYANDISHSTNGIKTVTKNFQKCINFILKKYNYEWQRCIYTDVGEISQATNLCAVNISCGYFNEHCENEVLSINHFINAINFAVEILQTVKKQHKHFNSFPVAKNSKKEVLDFDYFLHGLTHDIYDETKENHHLNFYCKECQNDDVSFNPKKDNWQCNWCFKEIE